MPNELDLRSRFLPRAVVILISCFLLCLAIGPVVARGSEGDSKGKSRESAARGDDVLLASAADLADHIVISEIYYNPEEEYDSEYIEFYNPTGGAVDLSSWSFSDDGGSTWLNFSEDTDEQNNLTIPAHGFLLLVDGGWSSGKDDSDWLGGDVVDELSLTNGGGTVKIRDSSGSVVDSATYEG
ncbi:lamin tail domain-containing protein, partial [Candidatus Bipolaricaulota bacterium]|nr:lamin tail domain-containing protein [Candidatus Bipolaricaulota bacterium]